MHTKTLILTCLLVVLMGFSATASSRGAYKWVDEFGTVHYSDRLRGDNAEVINVKVQDPEGEASAEDGTSPSTDGKQEAGQEKSREQLAREQQQREENCAKAREQLKRNKSLGRMYRVDTGGERHYLSDKERAEVIKTSEDAVEQWCD